MTEKRLNLTLLDFDDIRNPLLSGGQAKATYEVGKRLSKLGYKILIISSKYPDSKDRLEKCMYYKHIGLGSRFIRLNNLFYILSLPFFVRKLNKGLIIEYSTAPVSTMLTPLWTQLPVVGVPSTFNAREFSQKYHLPFQIIESLGIRIYKYFLPYTKDIEEKIRILNPLMKTKVVPNGVDDIYFRIKNKKPEYILFLGRFDIYQKGIDMLLEAYGLVKWRIGYPLILAGHGPDESKIKKLVINLDLKTRVKIIGPTYGKKKIKILERALFVALPSRHDDLPLFSLEALASGLPLVIFNIGEFHLFQNDISYKAKTFSVKDYAKALLKASNDQNIDKKREQCRNFAKNYSWEKTANDYDMFFRQVLKDNKRKIN